LRRILALPAAERWILLEACALILFFSCALRVLPFRLIGRRPLLWRRRRLEFEIAPARIAALVDAAGGALGRSCLPRALALARILASRGVRHEIHVGVRRAGSALNAHAWVTSSGEMLIGGVDAGAYVALAQLHPWVSNDSGPARRSW
jgi:Transglutaminase-like superfamily